jgi:hypothetical protein
MVLTIPVSAIQAYPELRNPCLKMQKLFMRSFLVPETGRNL